MTNTFGVNILNRNAPASKGELVETGTAFLIGPIGVGSTTAPAECHSIPDFETAFSARTSKAVAAWDWLDVYFREGGNTAYVLDYTTAGEYTAALALLQSRLGPGQVAVVGEEASSGLYKAIQAHTEATNRIGLLDVKSTDITKAALATEGALGTGLTTPETVGVFGSWLEAPAPSGVIGGSSRTVPASAAVAALCNRVDEEGNPNQPGGGPDQPLRYCTGVLYDPNDAERGELFTDGVNTFKKQGGQIINYGFVTPIAQTSATPFWELNCARARMYLTAEAKRIGQRYYMKDIDGQGKLAARLASDLKELCNKMWEKGALYGKTPEEAYEINVGVTVNTESDVAVGQLNAVASVKFSLYAAQVNITLVSVPILGVV
jgi:hypothetical protein